MSSVPSLPLPEVISEFFTSLTFVWYPYSTSSSTTTNLTRSHLLFDNIVSPFWDHTDSRPLVLLRSVGRTKLSTPSYLIRVSSSVFLRKNNPKPIPSKPISVDVFPTPISLQRRTTLYPFPPALSCVESHNTISTSSQVVILLSMSSVSPSLNRTLYCLMFLLSVSSSLSEVCALKRRSTVLRIVIDQIRVSSPGVERTYWYFWE